MLVCFATFVAFAYGHDPAPAAAPGFVQVPRVPVQHLAAQKIHTTQGTSSGTQRLSNLNRTSRYAAVLRSVRAHSGPSVSSKVVGRLTTRTPEGTTNVVLLLERTTVHGSLWIKVRLPVLPNDTTGWVPRAVLGGYNTVTTHLVVDTKRLRITLYKNGRSIFTAPIGVGRPGTPTPTGQFYIRDGLTKFTNPIYGPLAFGTSARSAVLTDWPGGGFVGIHGTNEPQIIPGRISHGCVRLRNADMLRLGKLMRPGTPLTIR